MPIVRNLIDSSKFNPHAVLPFELRLKDFELAMQDVYDFLFDVNSLLLSKGLDRLDDFMRKANRTGLISDMLTASLAKHSRALAANTFHNGHPDLVVKGRYPDNAVKSGTDGVEVKATLKAGGAVDTHGARDQWMCVFVYSVDSITEPAQERGPLTFSEVYLSQVTIADFRNNDRGTLGTRTATLDKAGVKKLRGGWVYRL